MTIFNGLCSASDGSELSPSVIESIKTLVEKASVHGAERMTTGSVLPLALKPFRPTKQRALPRWPITSPKCCGWFEGGIRRWWQPIDAKVSLQCMAVHGTAG
jgi:hypothetical protein